MRNLILVFALLSNALTQAQPYSDCKQLAERINADTTRSIWECKLPPATYYCLGRYFAERDIHNDIFLIQTYGNPEWDNPCKVCAYERYGFHFHYHWDIIEEAKTSFIKGYNEVSKAYLKKKIGNKAFAHIEDVPKSQFNPQQFLNENFADANIHKFFDAEEVDDTTVRVKFLADSLFKKYSQYRDKVHFVIQDKIGKNEKSVRRWDMDHKQIQESGFLLNPARNGRYMFNIRFDFSRMADETPYCRCALTDSTKYSYHIPLKLKE